MEIRPSILKIGRERLDASPSSFRRHLFISHGPINETPGELREPSHSLVFLVGKVGHYRERVSLCDQTLSMRINGFRDLAVNELHDLTMGNVDAIL
jgi:hypothetical protein